MQTGQLENLELGAHIAQPVIDVERGTRGHRAPDHTRRLDRRQFGQAKILANLGAELVLAGYADKLAFTVIGPIVIRTCKTRGMPRSEEHTSELQSLMRISYAVFCLKKNIHKNSLTSL